MELFAAASLPNFSKLVLDGSLRSYGCQSVEQPFKVSGSFSFGSSTAAGFGVYHNYYHNYAQQQMLSHGAHCMQPSSIQRVLAFAFHPPLCSLRSVPLRLKGGAQSGRHNYNSNNNNNNYKEEKDKCWNNNSSSNKNNNHHNNTVKRRGSGVAGARRGRWWDVPSSSGGGEWDSESDSDSDSASSSPSHGGHHDFGLGGNDHGLYPWMSHASHQFANVMEEDVVTFFTTDGLVHIRNHTLTHLTQKGKGKGKRGGDEVVVVGRRKEKEGEGGVGLRRFREEDYMNPNQGLCLGAIFDIAATNGLDRGRRLYVVGFTRSVEMLHDVVEDTVRDQGGQVLVAEKGTREGLHERLTMLVAVPLLWGVPPAMDRLGYAIRTGGGIVDKVYRRWDFI